MTHFDRLAFDLKRPHKGDIQALRTVYGKVFDNVDSTKTLCAQLGTPIHYKEETLNPESPLLDIDLTPQVFSDRWEFNKGLYSLTVADTGEVRYTSRAYGDLIWRPLEIGGNSNFHINPIHESIGLREFITFRDIRPGVDLLVRVGSAKMEPLFRIKTAQAPRQFLWEIDHADDHAMVIGQGGKGWEVSDGKRRPAKISKTEGAPLIANGRRVVRGEEIWSGEVVERGPDRKPVLKTDGKYPILVDPPDVSEQISSGIDDVFSGTSGGASTFSSANQFVNFLSSAPSTYVVGGLRFRSLAIPNGQAISTAAIKLAVFGVDAGGTIKFYADDVDDAALWSAANGPVGITKTTAFGTVAIPSVVSAIPDVTAAITNVVQEVVSRSGWASGADMRFAGFPQGGVLANIVAYDKTGTLIGNGAARLQVTFAAGGGFNAGFARGSNIMLGGGAP